MLKKILRAIVSAALFYKTKYSKHETKGPPPTSKDSLSAFTTKEYDLSHPQKKWTLPADLLEISGISWIDPTHLLAIEDLHRELYLLRLGDTVTIEKKIPFGKSTGDKFDVEDIAVVGNTVYVLWSHGKIFKIANWKNNPQVQEIKTFLKKSNNTEGLCYDPVLKNLLVACKDDAGVEDEKKSTRSVYEYNITSDTLNTEPFLLIHKKDFTKNTGEKLDFFPSAIDVHPITNDIYILSTKDNKCIAQYSHDGQLKSVHFLDKEMLPQPEGLCFARDGTMFLSTEGKPGEHGSIYQFNYSR
jgi:uncharacterized protein YjiK